MSRLDLHKRDVRLEKLSRINVAHLHQLESMGYPRRTCAEALKQSNNRLAEASEILLTNIDILLTATEEPARTDEHDDEDVPDDESVNDATHVPQLIALGAEPEEARALLEIHGHRLDLAAEELLRKIDTPTTTTDDDQSRLNDLKQRACVILDRRGKHRCVRSLESLVCLAAKRARTNERRAARRQRLALLEAVIPDLMNSTGEVGETGDDNHLDLLLDEEEAFICSYRQRLIDDGFW